MKRSTFVRSPSSLVLSVWIRWSERVQFIDPNWVERTQLSQTSNLTWTFLTQFSSFHVKIDIWTRPSVNNEIEKIFYLHPSSAVQSVMLALLPKNPSVSSLSCNIRLSFQDVLPANVILTCACIVPELKRKLCYSNPYRRAVSWV